MTHPEETGYWEMYKALDDSARSYLKSWNQLRKSRTDQLAIFGSTLADTLMELYTDIYQQYEVDQHVDAMIDYYKEENL